MPKSPFPALNEFITLLEKRLDGGEILYPVIFQNWTG